MSGWRLGTATEVVEVSAQPALIDPTQSKVQTNIPQTNLMNLPTQSLSYQSVIQFAPGARYEPLQNSGSSANNGFQINGASNSENSYLVDGLETASIFDGHSQANVPMDFIDEVQVKTSGFEAEYGGALGGVVNVISKRGSNEWHGSVFLNYNADRFNAAPNPTQMRNPSYGANLGGAPRLDQPLEYYYPVERPFADRRSGLHAGRSSCQGSSVGIPRQRAGLQPVAAHGEFRSGLGSARPSHVQRQQLHLLFVSASGFPGNRKDPPLWFLDV